MQSAIATFFLALQERIKTECPEIRYIDQDLGQLEFYSIKPAVSWPCVLMDVGDFNFTDFSEHVQNGDGLIVLRLGFTPFSSANSLAPDLPKMKALEFYDIEFRLQKALHGWAPEEGMYGNLIRVKATTEKRDDPYRVREISYRLSFEDYSTERQQLTHAATMKLKINPKPEGTGDFNNDFNNDFNGE